MSRHLWVKDGIVHNIVEYHYPPPETEAGFNVVPDDGTTIGGNFNLSAYLNLSERQKAKLLLALSSEQGKILRAVVAVLLDEVNILRQNVGLPQRTLAQAKAAITNKLDSGNVDA